MASATVLSQLLPSSSSTTANDPSHRQSLVSAHSSLVSSSANSFRTAPLATPTSLSPSSSRSSSVNTVPAEHSINPLHSLGASMQQHSRQEVHIVKVTGDTVHVEHGPVQDSFLHRVKDTVTTVVRGVDGPPPPSPPASIGRGDDDEVDSPTSPVPPTPPPKSPRMHSETLLSVISPRPIVFEEPEQIRERQHSSSSTATARITPIRSSTTADIHHLSTSDTKSSLSTLRTVATRITTHSDDDVPNTPLTTEGSASGSKLSNYLHPPPINYRPTRRNTTGSSTLTGRLSITGTRTSLHTHYSSQPYGDEPVSMDDMASDIQLHAEKIRRERMEKRAQQQAEAEAALTRGQEQPSRKIEDRPLVGNLIGEDHVNYVLMYNMLTGIRIGVSRCQAKIKRPITDEDFTARHKFSFDIVGNELTPSAKYDFKFKDYAPWVFRSLREDYFHLDPADYLLSLTSKYILSELGSPGKSGSFFYFSRDYRFIIKTIHHSEHKFLLSVLKDYYQHVKDNPHTLLSRFYGLHRVKLPRGRKIHFVIMNNLFPPHKDVHETYDLKGSTVGREYPEEEGKKDNPVLKDLNWINKGKMLELGPEKRALLTEQLRRDKEMLKKIHVMDYSLLVGIHSMERGNRDNVRKNTLKVFDPHIHRQSPGGAKKSPKGTTSPEAIAMRRAMRESDPKRLGKGSIRLPEEDTGDRQHFIFYQDEGGLRATDENNENMDTIYYLGVIDILTPWGNKKRLERLWKGMSADRHKISPVPPDEYADRFYAFMKAIMRGGDGGDSFKP